MDSIYVSSLPAILTIADQQTQAPKYKNKADKQT